MPAFEERRPENAGGPGDRHHRGDARIPQLAVKARQQGGHAPERGAGDGDPVGVDGPVQGERASAGRFDAYLGGWNVDPTPSTGIGGTWTSAAAGLANHVRYANPAFDDLVARATSGAGSPDSVRALWRRALEVFNDDAPAIVLFAMDNVAAVHARVADVRIRPDSHWALVRTWRIPADRMIERDRVAPAAN